MSTPINEAVEREAFEAALREMRAAFHVNMIRAFQMSHQEVSDAIDKACPKALALTSTPAPQCHCEACEPHDVFRSRMILCATCGNKRCPHATDHRNACTNSNAPGQAGSSYANCAALPPPIVEPVKTPVMWMVYISGLPEAFRTYAEAERERRDYEAGTDEPREDPVPLHTPASAPTIRKSQTVAPASTLGQQVARAQAEVATWSPEKRASVRLEGSGQYTPASAPSDGAADARDGERYRAIRTLMESAKGSASIEVNQHLAYYDPCEPGKEVKLQWYPDTPIGFYVIEAATFDEMADAAIASTHTTTGGENG